MSKRLLKDIVQLNPKEYLEKGSIAKHIAMEKLTPFTRKISGFEVKEYKGGMKFRNGDTLFARITPCLENGKIAYVSILDENEVGFGSTEYIIIREKENISDGKYLYYLSISPSFRNFAIRSMTGTSGRQRVQLEDFSNMPISLPPLSEQKRIASILSSFDDKIELLKNQNQTLENIAQTIFKRWFVEFNFPDKDGKPYKDNGGKMVDSELGEIPEGWGVRSLGEFFPVRTGKRNANFATPTGKYKFFTCSQGDFMGDEHSFDCSAILLAGNGDFSLKWYQGKFDAYQRTYVLIPYDEKLLGYLFFAMKYHLNTITIGNRGSVIKFLTKGMIENFKIVSPEESSEQIKLVGIFDKIISRLEGNYFEIEKLVTLKQILLRNLIN